MTRLIFARRLTLWRRHAPAVMYALSVAIGQALVWFLHGISLALVAALAGVLLITPVRRKIGFVLAGILLGVASALCISSGPAPVPTAKDVIVHGVVVGAPRHPVPGEVVFYLSASVGEQQGLLRCKAVELPWRNAARLEEGDLVWVRGDIEAVVPTLNPMAWGSSQFRKGVSGECKARFVSRSVSRNPSWDTRLRDEMKQLAYSAVGESQGSGLFLSMALGYQDLISLSVEKAFKRLGLTHLLVVSGYQVSLLFGFVLSFFSLLPISLLPTGRFARSVTHTGALLVASCYVVCIGLEMSAVRALVAAVCLTAQLVSERGSSFAQRWGVALLVMELLWPWCFFEIGVILTFAALFGIGLGARIGGTRGLKAAVGVNLGVWLCTSLVIVMWSGTISLIGLLVNLLVAAPWSVANCAVGLSALGAVWVGVPGAGLVLKLLVWINHKLSMLVLDVSEWSFSSIQLEGSWRVVGASVLAITILALIVRLPRTPDSLLVERNKLTPYR